MTNPTAPLYTRVYRYGLLRPITNADKVDDQIRLAHRYRNTLVAIERARRAATREILSSFPEVAVLEAKAKEAADDLEKAREEIKSTRKQSRKRTDTKEQRAASSRALARKKDVDRSLREARFAVKETSKPLLEEIQARSADLRRNAREHCGLGSAGPHTGAWGTYLLVEEAADRSFESLPLYSGVSGNEPNDPRFVRWGDVHAIGVQIQGGMPRKDFVNTITRQLYMSGSFQTSRSRKWNDVIDDHHRPHRWTSHVLHVRIGSEGPGGKEPVWAQFPIVYDKQRHPIPEDAIIKGARIVRTRTADKFRWHVCITVQTSERANRKPLGVNGPVAIDIGWRLMPNGGIRVAKWRGEDGTVGELNISPELVSTLKYPDTLRSIRDTHFDAARAALHRFLQAADERNSSEFIRTSAKGVWQWRSAGRLSALLDGWQKTELTNPAEKRAREDLRLWRDGELLPDSKPNPDPDVWHGDVHLWTWECHQRRRALNKRKELYRLFASEMAGKFSTLVLEEFDLSQVARRPATESEVTENETARSNRQLACVSELRLCLTNAFAGRGGTVEKETAVDTTRLCECGAVGEVSIDAGVVVTCSACGCAFDQDDRACVNLLNYRRERLRDRQNDVSARGKEKENEVTVVKESRWARAKREKRERKASGEGARKAVGNDAK